MGRGKGLAKTMEVELRWLDPVSWHGMGANQKGVLSLNSKLQNPKTKQILIIKYQNPNDKQ
jgi:hypothetical protein